MSKTIFYCDETMPAAEQPFAKPRETRDGPFMMMEMPRPETVRTMLTEADRRISQRSALYPDSRQEVHNLSPAKRGRHY